MPREVDNTFTRLRDWTDDAAASVPMTPSRFDSDLDDIAAALSDTPTRTEMDAAIAAGLGTVDLSVTRTSTTVTVVNPAGDDAVLPAADGTNAGVLTAALFTKLAGIAEGADDTTALAATVVEHTADIAAVEADIVAIEAAATALATRVPVGVPGAATGAATLDSSARLNDAQIPTALIGALVPQGAWNASTNSPTLTGGAGTAGHWYRVSTEGTTSLDGIATWRVDDIAYFDGTAWRRVLGQNSEGVPGSGGGAATTIDGRVRLTGTTNTHGGAKYQVAVTEDGRLLAWGDVAGFAFNPVGDRYAAYEIPVPWASTVTIERVYCGINYILVQTDEASGGNLYHIGSSADGQGGHGGTSAVTTLTKISALSSVRISYVWTEGSYGAEAFWFALTTTGALYSCGYSGATHTMGYNSTTNLSTPRLMTESDGTTALAGIVEVSCAAALAPVFARTSAGKLYRWGAGTDGAHGNNGTSAMTWPDPLETAHGSGVDRTDIAQAVVVGGNATASHAAAWILTTAGKIECAGAEDYGIGDGTALGASDQVTFTAASGAIAALTTSKLRAGGGQTPICIAITSTGNGYAAGRMTGGLLGDGSTSDLNVFTALASLPTGFAGALTDARVAGAYNNAEHCAIFLEATISGAKALASIGYDDYYATARGVAGVAAASRTWGRVVGTRGSISSWYTFGTGSEYGVAILNTDGELRYAGANDQGQSGCDFGLAASVDTLQVVKTGISWLLKPWTHRGEYSALTSYSYNDVVTYGGSSFIYSSSTATTGNAPPTYPTTSNTYWRLSAQIGPSGPAGRRFTWSTATSGDAGTGTMRGNNATIASITSIVVSETDAQSGSMATTLATWDDSTSTTSKGLIQIVDLNSPANFYEFRVSGLGSSSGGYRTITVVHVATSGTITNGRAIAVQYIRNGDRGPEPASISYALRSVQRHAPTDPDIVAAITDQRRRRLWWVDDTGQSHLAGDHIIGTGAIEAGLPVLYTAEGLRVEVTQGTPTPLAVQAVRNNRLVVTEDHEAYYEHRTMLYGSAADYGPVFAGNLHMHVPIIGQSLSAGSNGTAPYYQVPLENWPDNCFMLRRVLGTSDIRGGLSGQSTSASFTSTDFDDFEPITEKVASSGTYGQTIASGVGSYMQKQARLGAGIPHRMSLMSTGVGGQAYAALAKTTTPYNNTIQGVVAARDIVRNRGGQLYVPAVLVLHGESDVGSATYDDNITTWQTDYDGDIKSYTAQTGDIPFIMHQPSSFIVSPNSGSHIQMVERMRTLPAKFLIASASYFLHVRNFVDGLHLASPEYRDLGEYFGKALTGLIKGTGWTPLVPILVERKSARKVRVKYNVPVKPLVLDTTTVTEPVANAKGFRIWSATDTTVTISSVALYGANGDELEIDTSEDIPTGAQLWYALNAQASTRDVANVPRGCVRDSDPALSTRDGTTPLWNWAIHTNNAIPDAIS